MSRARGASMEFGHGILGDWPSLRAVRLNSRVPTLRVFEAAIQCRHHDLHPSQPVVSKLAFDASMTLAIGLLAQDAPLPR